MAQHRPVWKLSVGEEAPDFELMGTGNSAGKGEKHKKVRLSDYRGKKKVMLLFYPMDFSPVCTQEHCTFGPAFDKLNATVSVTGEGITLEVRRENLEPALRLAAEVLREPAFSPHEFEEMKRAALTGAESQRTDPSALASLQLARHLAAYPKGHPHYTPDIEERREAEHGRRRVERGRTARGRRDQHVAADRGDALRVGGDGAAGERRAVPGDRVLRHVRQQDRQRVALAEPAGAQAAGERADGAVELRPGHGRLVHHVGGATAGALLREGEPTGPEAVEHGHRAHVGRTDRPDRTQAGAGEEHHRGLGPVRQVLRHLGAGTQAVVDVLRASAGDLAMPFKGC